MSVVSKSLRSLSVVNLDRFSVVSQPHPDRGMCVRLRSIRWRGKGKWGEGGIERVCHAMGDNERRDV